MESKPGAAVIGTVDHSCNLDVPITRSNRLVLDILKVFNSLQCWKDYGVMEMIKMTGSIKERKDSKTINWDDFRNKLDLNLWRFPRLEETEDILTASKGRWYQRHHTTEHIDRQKKSKSNHTIELQVMEKNIPSRTTYKFLAPGISEGT